MNFCVYPAGAWSTAVALQLDRLGHVVTLVPLTMEEALEVSTSRENKRYLPGVRLPNSLQIGMELKPALMEADTLVLGPPSQFLRSVCRQIRENLSAAWRLSSVVLLTKGLEEETNSLAYDVLKEELPELDGAILSGPTFASQVAQGKPSALVLAGRMSDERLASLQEAISGPSFRVYTSTDVSGVCLGGSMKNVYAIAAGACDGLDLGDNARAALLTRSLAEMVRVGQALGGSLETFFGLSGFGDLVLTCNGEESRNRTFGEQLARGASVNELISMGRTVEGYRTCACFHRICEERGISAPILQQIYKVLYEGQNPADTIEALMTRSLKSEWAGEVPTEG